MSHLPFQWTVIWSFLSRDRILKWLLKLNVLKIVNTGLIKIQLKILSIKVTCWFHRRFTETVVQRCSVKKVLLKILQNSQENPCAGVVSLIKLQASGFLRTPFFIELLWWLLLHLQQLRLKVGLLRCRRFLPNQTFSQYCSKKY